MVGAFFRQFGSLDDTLVEKLTARARRLTLERGEFFIRTGETSDRIGLVEGGCLRYFYLRDGEEITGEFWKEGELLGSYDTAILGRPGRLSIEALEPSVLWVMAYSDVQRLAAGSSEFQAIIIRILERLLVESQERIAAYITETAEERYLRLRREKPGIEDRVHQKYIASFVGVTPVTLSRIRARLARRRTG